jgi:hypothetical protein
VVLANEPAATRCRAIRDSTLAIAGTLTEELGGPSIRVPLEPEVYDTIFTEAEPDNSGRFIPDVATA